MAITSEESLRMLGDRLRECRPELVALEAVLLRSALERVDDFLIWLDQHFTEDHPEADLETIGKVIHMTRQVLLAEATAVNRALEPGGQWPSQVGIPSDDP